MRARGGREEGPQVRRLVVVDVSPLEKERHFQDIFLVIMHNAE